MIMMRDKKEIIKIIYGTGNQAKLHQVQSFFEINNVNLVEDYSLEVGSVSLTDPFKSKMQYQKHLNHAVEVLAVDGKKYRGTLVSVDDDSFLLDTEVTVAVEGKKRKQKEVQTLTFAYDGVKYTKYDLKF